MKAIGCLVGGILSIALAFHHIGFTSAIQADKTLFFAFILCLVLCPTLAWVFGKLRRKSNYATAQNGGKANAGT
jgi:heme/copper-type cytochrome/quinol oxidase subunit 1